MHYLKVENYVLFGRLSEDLSPGGILSGSPGGILSGSSEGLFLEGKEGAGT